jgi:hypothetical protein
MWGIHGWWDKNLKKTIEMVQIEVLFRWNLLLSKPKLYVYLFLKIACKLWIVFEI